MDLPETDSEDEIPPGWEERCTADGLVFYAYHETKTTQWTHPRTGKRKRVTGELPFGWERQISDDGKILFIDHKNNKTTYIDPRLAFAVEETEGLRDLRQRFDRCSTGLQVTHGRDLSGLVAIVTGANSGIGFETAKSLAFRGCRVIFACRNDQAAAAGLAALRKERPYCNCETFLIDLTSLNSVKRFVQKFKTKIQRCDILVLNAGVFSLPYTQTEDGFEATFQINFLSQFYLALLIQPLMVSSQYGRLVFVSSESHRFTNISSEDLADELCPKESEYLPVVAYNNSKLCAILACFEFHRRFVDAKLHCFAVHPGNLVCTKLSRHWWAYRLLFTLVRPFAKSPQQACASSVFCAVSPDLHNCGGLYINNCVPCPPSAKALDPILANRLWITACNWIESRIGKRAFFLEETF